MKNTDLFFFQVVKLSKCKVQGFFVTFGKKKKKWNSESNINIHSWKGVSEIGLKL